MVEVLRDEPARVTIRGLRRSFYPPSHLPPVDNSPPEKKLQLEWVYGYRGTDTRRNLWVLPSGELLYYVAAVAVLFDREENAQRHYVGHTEDITCMEVYTYISWKELEDVIDHANFVIVSGSSEQGVGRVRAKSRQAQESATARAHMVDRDVAHPVRVRDDRVPDGRLRVGVLAAGKNS